MSKILGIILACAITLAGCDRKANIEQCWAPATKKDAESLANRMMVDQFAKFLEDATSSTKAPIPRENLESSIKVTLDQYSVKSADKSTGNFECDAWGTVTYTKPDDKKQFTTNEQEIPFELVNSEVGPQVVMNGTRFSAIMVALEKKIMHDNK